MRELKLHPPQEKPASPDDTRSKEETGGGRYSLDRKGSSAMVLPLPAGQDPEAAS